LAPSGLIILAGGQGQRLGGQNKALKSWQGQPILKHLLQQACALLQFEQIVVVANQDLLAIEAIIRQSACRERIQCVSDCQPGFLGPLIGIASGLAEIKASQPNSWVQLWPVDSPGSMQKVMHFLQQNLMQNAESKPLILLPHDGNRPQPLFAQISTDILPELTKAIQQGRYGVTQLFQSLSHQKISVASLTDELLNLNTESQWHKAQDDFE